MDPLSFTAALASVAASLEQLVVHLKEETVTSRSPRWPTREKRGKLMQEIQQTTSAIDNVTRFILQYPLAVEGSRDLLHQTTTVIPLLQEIQAFSYVLDNSRSYRMSRSELGMGLERLKEAADHLLSISNILLPSANLETSRKTTDDVARLTEHNEMMIKDETTDLWTSNLCRLMADCSEPADVQLLRVGEGEQVRSA